jgi:hypothetical protein
MQLFLKHNMGDQLLDAYVSTIVFVFGNKKNVHMDMNDFSLLLHVFSCCLAPYFSSDFIFFRLDSWLDDVGSVYVVTQPLLTIFIVIFWVGLNFFLASCILIPTLLLKEKICRKIKKQNNHLRSCCYSDPHVREGRQQVPHVWYTDGDEKGGSIAQT